MKKDSALDVKYRARGKRKGIRATDTEEEKCAHRKWILSDSTQEGARPVSHRRKASVFFRAQGDDRGFGA